MAYRAVPRPATRATPAAASASDAELAVGTNWAKVYSDKNIRIVACKHNV
jgi:hypothetical protein